MNILGLNKTSLLALALALGTVGCAGGPEGGDGNSVIDLGAVGGKADGIIDLELPTLGIGDETVVRFTTRDAMDIKVVRHSGVSVELTVTPGPTSATSGAEPTALVPSREGAVEQAIRIRNTGDQTFTGRITIEFTTGLADDEAQGEEPETPAPDVVKIVTATEDQILNGTMEATLSTELDESWDEVLAFGYHSSASSIRPMVWMEKDGQYRAEAGSGYQVLVAMNGAGKDGWNVVHYDHGRIADDGPSILWLEKAGTYRSYLGTEDKIMERANTMADKGWEVQSFLQRGSAPVMVAWLEREDGTFIFEADADVGEVEDWVAEKMADDSTEYTLRSLDYTGAVDSVAWVVKDGEYSALTGDSPQALAVDLEAHTKAGFEIVDIFYQGAGTVAWMTKGGEVEVVAGADAPELDLRLDALVADGWELQTLLHNGPSPAVAVLTRDVDDDAAQQ